MVEDEAVMKDELVNSDVLKKDLKKIVGHVTPYLPYTGLITGGIIEVRYVGSSKKDKENFEEEQRPKGEQTD